MKELFYMNGEVISPLALVVCTLGVVLLAVLLANAPDIFRWLKTNAIKTLTYFF